MSNRYVIQKQPFSIEAGMRSKRKRPGAHSWLRAFDLIAGFGSLALQHPEGPPAGPAVRQCRYKKVRILRLGQGLEALQCGQ